jgi:hypothetical protein
MTVNELIQLRDQIRDQMHSLQSELESIEIEVANWMSQLQTAESNHNAALNRLQAARDRLTQLVALRDQISAVEAEVQLTEAEVANVTAQLSALLDNMINQFREMVAAIRNGSVPIIFSVDRLNQVIEDLDHVQFGDLDARLRYLPRVLVNMRALLVPQNPRGGIVEEWLIQISQLGGQAQALGQQRSEALTLAQDTRNRLNELIARSEEIPQAEAEVNAAEAETLRLSAEAQNVQQELNDARGRAESHRNQMEALRQQYQQQLDRLITGLDPQVPIALLPVRLETRFKNGELWIRIYPDDIHQDTHEPELTSGEVQWGQHFWQEVVNAGIDQQERLQVWGQLAARFGPTRAAWIARATDPSTPGPGSRDGSWTRAPYTRVLPDRWLAIGYIRRPLSTEIEEFDRIVQWGELIPDPLNTGPSPGVKELDDYNMDEGMRWMADFDEAVKKGMGIRLPLTSEQAASGLDRLLVLGVKGTLNSNQSAELLQSLFDAHHYTWGLGFAPVGTPTNNTNEARSGYAERDSGYERSFAAEQGNNLCQSGDGSDGDQAALALGLSQTSPFVFAHVSNSNGHDQQDAKNINTVMWPITWGYFLTQIMDRVFRSLDLNSWHEFFIEYVRARGPLPSLRISNQPYGLLPVTSLEFVPTTAGVGPFNAADLLIWLRTLQENWRRALVEVPYHNQPRNNQVDPDQNLLSILSMDATSSTYSGRRALGPIYTENLWWFLNDPLDEAWKNQRDALTQQTIAQFNVSSRPRSSYLTYAAQPFDISIPLVEAGPVSETEPLQDNYIEWLIHATPLDIHDQKYPGGTPPKALLYRLLRHATLQAYADAALELMPVLSLLEEPELVDFLDFTNPDPGPSTVTSWRYLHQGPDFQGQKLDQYLHEHLDNAAVAQLRRFLDSLTGLRKLPTATLERLVEESLDLSSHRLDAWITSVANYRLHEMRQPGNSPTGIHLGGYGWVEDLRPRSGLAGHNAGFIHAPSLAHAATAAVLRSGYLSHSDSNQHDALALDLSSRRVRLTKWLLDGVRSGQPLGGLLGYRFERGLHENHPDLKLDKYIAPFRELTPLVAGKLIPKDPEQPLTSIAANNVVHGLDLLQRWKKGKSTKQWDENTIPFGQAGFPPKPVADRSTLPPKEKEAQKEYDAVEAELESLEYVADAINDTVIAESVHQAIQGNPLRAGASLDAISRGEVPPQELEVARTPRTGIALTHRILVLFSGTASEDSYTTKWKPSGATSEEIEEVKTRQVRAAAEPHLNAWAAKLLGDPAKVFFQAEYLDPINGQALLPPEEFSLQELNLCPLDVLYASLVSEQAQRSDLEQWLAYHALKNRPTSPMNVPADANVRLIFTRGEQWTSDMLSFPEFLEIARAARELIVSGRALDARDVSQPVPGVERNVDLRDLQVRAGNAGASLEGAYEELRKFFVINDPNDLDLLRASSLGLSEAQLSDLSNLLDLPVTVDLGTLYNKLATTQAVDLDQLRETLLRFAYFGLAGAVPFSLAGNTEEDRIALLNQARSLADVVSERRHRIRLISGNDPLARLEEVFGREFRVLPHFTSGGELSQAFARRTAAQDAEADQVIPWFHRIARVRDGASRLEVALMYAEAVGAGDSLSFQVAQLPVSTDDRWVGLNAEAISGGRLSLVAHVPNPFDTSQPLQPLTGLLIDEWVEVVPNPKETTAITFHYDAPGACPPQAILLAVPPELGRPWNVDILEAILLETLELAKLRAVDPDALAAYGILGHYLPALFFAYNKGGDPNGDTIATDFKVT